MKRFIIIIAAFALCSCGTTSPRCASKDAQGLVEALRPEKQFKSMLKAVVEHTQTAGIAARGDISGPQKIQQAIDDAVERHGAEWKHNLVLSWQTLSAADLEKVCTALDDRDQQTFRRFAERVGLEVKSRNEPLLRRSAIEVLKAVW